ncbi:MAG: hypothetical protein MMC33_010752 [Icmadophila ericetorum]|nr:hypothetical protein [Icmadophila ericetorum]
MALNTLMFTLLLAFAALGYGQSTNDPNDHFNNPPAFPSDPYTSRSFQQWKNGSSQSITWNTDFPTITMLLSQNYTQPGNFSTAINLTGVGDPASKYNGKLDWTVLIDPTYFDLSESTYFMVTCYNGSYHFVQGQPWDGAAFYSDWVNFPTGSGGGLSKAGKTAIGIIFGIIVPLLLVAGYFYWRHRRNRR